MSFFVYVIIFFQFRITWLFCNVLFCNIRKLIWLIIYLHLLSLLICLIFFWLLLTLFLLASLLICLHTWSLSINIKHFCFFFDSLPILADFLKFRPPLSHLFWPHPFIKFNKNSPDPSPHPLSWPLRVYWAPKSTQEGDLSETV